MRTHVDTTVPMLGSSKFARALIIGVLTFAMGVSGFSSASAAVKTVTVGTISATPVAGTASTPTYTVTTANIADAEAGTIDWVTDATGATPAAGAPTGITVTPDVAGVAANELVLNVAVLNTADAGDSFFTVTVDGVTSAVITLTVDPADSTPPSVAYSPIHNATDVAITVAPTITFSEAVRKLDNSAVTNDNVGDLVTFKKTDAAGAAVAFTATINDAKTVITITPTSSLDNNQIYYLGIGATVEDAAGNAITSSHARFTTIAPAPAPAPVVVASPGISAAEAAAIRAANEAAAKAEAEKVAKVKAEADAKATAEAAAKALADKAALEKAAAEKAAADKVEAERNAAAQAIVEAEEARVAAVEAKAAATNVKLSTSRTGLRLTLDLPDKYVGKIVTIFVGTTVKGKTTFRKLDFFALDKEDGTATISSKVKLTKGQVIRVNVGRTVLQTLRVR